MKKFLKAIGTGIIAAIAVKLAVVIIIHVVMKLREFSIEVLDFIENCYKGIVYPFTTRKSPYYVLLEDAKDWDAPFEEGGADEKA